MRREDFDALRLASEQAAADRARLVAEFGEAVVCALERNAKEQEQQANAAASAKALSEHPCVTEERKRTADWLASVGLFRRVPSGDA